jgi:hypothetical protein
MSGKGGSSKNQTQTTVSEPWKAAQPYLTDIMGRGQTLSQQQPSYYGGPLTVGPTGAESTAWGTRAGYNNQVFGGQQLNYGSAANALNQTMAGSTPVGNMAGQIAPQATNLLTQGFQAPNTSGLSGIQSPAMSSAASNIGNYGFGTSLDASGRAPQFGVAGDLDARGAYQRMLSGTPDYEGVQGAIDAANAPILRQLNEQIIPGLNQKATFSNNSTGGIKALNRVLPEVGQRMGENAQNITNQERLRALGSQEAAANAISQGGFQGYGLGLQTAQGERGLEQALAGMGLQTDTTRGQLQLSDTGANLDRARLDLGREGAILDANDRYRADLLNYGSLAGQLGGQATGQSLQAAGLFPAVNQVGRQPGDDALAYANYDRALREDALSADQDQFNYMRDQPYNNLGWYQSLISGTASPYGTQSQTGPAGSRTAGALGGAMFGAGMANQMGYGGWGQLIGAGLGGLGGYYGG